MTRDSPEADIMLIQKDDAILLVYPFFQDTVTMISKKMSLTNFMDTATSRRELVYVSRCCFSTRDLSSQVKIFLTKHFIC